MEAAAAECMVTKTRAKCRIPWESLVIKKNLDNMKIAFLLNKRKPINTNAQKLKKAQRELIQTKKNNKNIFKDRSIKQEIRLKIDNHE